MTLDEQATVDRLCAVIRDEWPTVHVRFGDGDIFFATGTGPKITADGEEWTPYLASRLRLAWDHLALSPYLLVGDVESYDVSDGCEEQWRGLLHRAEHLRGEAIPLVHIEALRCGRGRALPFYQTLAESPLRKVYIAPARLEGAARMLNADHFEIPLARAHEAVGDVVGWIDDRGYDVAIFSAGRGGKIMQSQLDLWKPGVMQFDVGSGLDLLFTGLRRGTDLSITPKQIEALRGTYREAGLAA